MKNAFNTNKKIEPGDNQLNKHINEYLYMIPSENETLQVEVSNLIVNGTLCQTSNQEWTPWSSSFLANGNDFETLYDHRRKYGLVEDLSLLICLFTQIFLEFVIHRHTFKRGKRRHRYLGLKVNRFLFMTQN